jgi:predicted chitinase
MPLITEEQLKKIFTNCKTDKIKLYCEAFNKVWPQFGITTPKRIAAFLGQVGVESGELKYDKELPSKWNMKDPKDPREKVGTLYEGRKPLGNTQPGDGPKFIGRGILQLTGRANYTEYAKKLKVDLVNNPDLAMLPEVSVMVACQYFVDRKLLEAADVWNLDLITERVNGRAKLHHDKRVAYSETALKILISQ